MFISDQFNAVDPQEDIRSDKSNALISIDKRMISNDPECISSREVAEIGFSIAIQIYRSRERRFQKTKIPNSWRAAMLSDLPFVHHEDNLAYQPYRRDHLASSRKQWRYFAMPSSAACICASTLPSCVVINTAAFGA